MKDHVDKEDKQKILRSYFTPLIKKGNPNITIINESGLYSLVLASKLQSAKKFKRWVTSEVLPTIRKTGTYSMNPPKIEEKSTPTILIEKVENLNVYIDDKSHQTKTKRSRPKMYDLDELLELLVYYADSIGSRRDQKSGKDMYTCPFCHSGEHGIGSTGAMHIGRGKDGKLLYYCHSCNSGGNIINMYCQYHGITQTKENFPQIINGIRQDLGLSTEDYQDFKKSYKFRNPVQNDDLNPQSKVDKKDYTNFFKLALQNQGKAIEYLRNVRKIEYAESISQYFQIGFIENYAYEWKDNQPYKTTSAIIIPTSPHSYAWRSTTENLKKKSGTVRPLNIEVLNDKLKKYLFLVEGEFDLFSILDITNDIPNCEFSAISVNSAGNLPRFLENQIKEKIQEGVTLIIALDNDTEPNPNVENFIKKGLDIAKKNKIPCVVADVKTLYLNQKDSNDALKFNREEFKKALINEVEKAKKIDIDTYMKECEDIIAHQEDTQTEQPIPNIEEMLATVTEENIISDTILGYILQLNDKISINKYIMELKIKAREFKKINIKDFEELCNSYKQKALEKIKLKIKQEQSYSAYPDWIETDKKGMPCQTIDNCWNILKNDSVYKGRITYNTFTNQMFLDGKLWKDSFFSKLVYHFETNYKITNENKINHAINLEADENSFHPIIDYLNSLQKWDGVKRLETLFIDFLGTKDDKYTRAVPIVTLCGAIARIMNPGVKYDTMTVLVGKQGTGKSTFWNKLGGEWFSDNVDTIKGKEAYESIQNSWIIEFAELSALGRASVEEIKKFTTKCIDKYRKPYAVNSEAIPRQCIFVGTTNTYDFLRDETGNRRFYPIDIDIDKATKSIWNDLTPEYVGLLWAEALYLYQKHGEKVIYIKDKEVLRLAELQQSEHFEKSITFAEVEAYLTMPVPPDWNTYNIEQRQNFIARYQKDSNTYATEIRKTICVKEILVDLYSDDFNVNSKIDNKTSKEIVQILEALGFRFAYSSKTKLFGSQRIYKKD